MRTLLAAAAVATLLAASAPPRSAIGQVPSLPSGPRFEIAEVRGLGAVPPRADLAFGDSSAGPTFTAETCAVVAKFQTASALDGEALSIVWMRRAGGAPVQLATERVAADEFSSGAYAMLAAGGSPLAPGRYQVSVVEDSGKILCALEFSVLAPAAGAARAAAPEAAASVADDASTADMPFALGDLELRVPAGYAATMRADGSDNAVTLVRFDPACVILVAVRASGSYRLATEALRCLREASGRLAAGAASRAAGSVTAVEVRDLGSADLGGRAATCRVVVADTGGGRLRLTLYLTTLDGKSALVGYVTRLADRSAASADDAERGANDFYRVVESLRSRGPEAPRVSPPPPSEPARADRARDVAAVRP
jgi:hypothetical protein